MLPIINILLIVGILLFILYNLYIDTRNWSNTGSFLEGMENASSLAEYMGAKGGYDFSSADEAKAKCEADGLQLCKKEEVIAGAKSKDSLQNVCSTGWTQDEPRGWYSVKGRSGCGSDNNWNTWAPPSGKGSAHCCKPAPVSDLGNKWSTKGAGVCRDGNDKYPAWGWGGTDEQTVKTNCSNDETCKAVWKHSNGKYQFFCTETGGVCSSNGNGGDALSLRGSGTQGTNECLVKESAAPATSDASNDTPAPAASGSTQTGAGSAEDAIENQVRSRAGNVAPMGSNVPQNCKKGCIAPTGPNGNCKVIQKDGAEKRECSWGCPNPTFKRGDTVNCAYDRDCNSCGTVLFNPDDPPQMPPSGKPVDGVNTNSWVGSRIDVPGIQNAPGLNPGGQTVQGQMGQGQMGQGQMGQGQMGQGQTVQGQMGQGQMNQEQTVQGQMNQGQTNQGQMANNQYIGELEMSTMNVVSPASVATSSNAIFDENIMKQVLENKDLIPSDINTNNEETSFNSRIGKKFMIDTATIRNFALPNIEENDYIELGRIVKNIKMREKDPQEIDQVKVLYDKLNKYVLELLTDSSLDMTGYNNNNIPKQLNNKTRTTGMFGENSNSLISNTDTHKNKRRSKVKSYNSLWSLYG